MYMTERKRLRVALLFGGKSTEHEVSLTSTVGILKNINQDKYYILPVKITKRGRWMLLSDPTSLDSVESLSRAEGVPVVIGDPEAKGLFRIRKSSDRSPSDVFSYIPVDVAFPILHGTFGEDGTIQGLLSTADLPFVGAGVLASALGMDKIMMKQIFFQNELPSADFMWFLRKDWKTSAEVIRIPLFHQTSEFRFECRCIQGSQ
jgi:D-alanine-D-alanine ligase